jgi:hypothetical protein
MPQFAFRWIHPPDQCPLTNSKVRQLVLEKAPAMPTIAQDLGVKIVAGPYVFATEHEGIIIMEASNVEVINEFALRSGFGQWNAIKVVLAQPIEEAMKELDTVTPIY